MPDSSPPSILYAQKEFTTPPHQQERAVQVLQPLDNMINQKREIQRDLFNSPSILVSKQSSHYEKWNKLQFD